MQKCQSESSVVGLQGSISFFLTQRPVMKKREIVRGGKEEKDTKGYGPPELQALCLWPPVCWLWEHSQTGHLDAGLTLTWIWAKS